MIGNAKIQYNRDGVRIVCDVTTRDDAPAFGESTDNMSQRWPSYSSWDNFTRALKLEDVMYPKRGNGGVSGFSRDGVWFGPLIPSHPGVAPITEAHVEIIEEKLAEYKAEHPTHVAKFPLSKSGTKSIDACGEDVAREYEGLVHDGNLCRAEWLLYWCKWAIKNCSMPVFVNLTHQIYLN